MNALQRPISHPARLFSFCLLDGPQEIAVSINGRLTKTQPTPRLAGVHTRDAPYSARRGPAARTNVGVHYSSRRASCEKPRRLNLSRFVAAFRIIRAKLKLIQMPPMRTVLMVSE